MLKLKNIYKDYVTSATKVEALKGIDLEFRKNEFVSILGPSGCGKTTMLNIVGGLDRYTSGDLLINGVSTKLFNDYDWDSYRNHSIGFIFQSYNLISHLSVLRNVELALTLSGVSKSERKRKATEALKSVGLEDQIHKKPNQLSGGQMQRVAVARALVNNPDILLADEPTGALDTQTSVQLMDLLKEIAKERLVIMVTHNGALARDYSTRIIKLLDGKVIDDSNPYHTEQVVVEKEKRTKKKTQITSMSFLTALELSLKNLTTKKGRTFLTSFAGSIGIIGIALVLALSTGFQNYINKMQADTLSNYPLTISASTIDFAKLMGRMPNQNLKEYPLLEEIYINKLLEMSQDITLENNITQEYIDGAIKTIDPTLYNAINYEYEMNFHVYKQLEMNGMPYFSAVQTSSSSSGMFSSGGWQEMIENPEFIESQYDVLAGEYPSSKEEIVIIVDKYNRISDLTLMQLGLYSPTQDLDKLSFDDVVGQKYRLLLNNDFYTLDSGKYVKNKVDATLYEKGIPLTIVGILRVNEETQAGVITSSVAYTKELTDYVLHDSLNSEIVAFQKENPTMDVLTGDAFDLTSGITVEEAYQAQLAELGGTTIPSDINIYPVDFDSKELIKKHLDDYNTNLEEKDKVYYSDTVEVLISSINTVINSISYILIAFTAVSLVVSSIMIGIITYISVLERTKEIGILRSIGARKKDISRVFNAETISIGFIAGLIGIVTTLLLSIPINLILENLINVGGIASLNPLHGIILILISMTLTLIAGIIPSRIAAKKDPVVALRSE